jgi:outer membrane protein
MSRASRSLVGAVSAWAMLAAAGATQAETLADALSWAYGSNPDLQAARANLRSVDEGYVQARSGWQPTASLDLNGQYNKGPNTDIFGTTSIGESNSGTASITVNQPIYTGGLVSAKVKQAQSDIIGQRQSLRGEEADVLFGVVSGYMDVLRDQQSLDINRDALTAFGKVVDEITARRGAGELTRTDIAQAQAQFLNQQAIVNSAEAQLQASVASYVQVVGQNPGTLVTPGDLPGMPANVDDAYAIADKSSPSLGVAQSRAVSAQTQVSQARSQFLPKVSVTARYGTSGILTPFDSPNFRPSVVGQLTVSQPLFAGGLHASQVRQAEALADASRNAVESARRSVVLNVANAWNAMITAQRNVESGAAGVDAANQALQGMQVEYRADQRSTYDLLNAQSNLYSAQLNLVRARHDRYLAAARLLGTIGRLEADQLIPGLNTYKPEANFNKVKNNDFLPVGYIPAALDKVALPDPAPVTAPPLREPAGPLNLRPSVDVPAPNAVLTKKLPTKSRK